MNNQTKLNFDIPEGETTKPQENGFTLIRKQIIERTFNNVIKKYGSITEASLKEFDMKWGVNLHRECDDAEEIARWINEFSKKEIVSVVDSPPDNAGKLYKLKLVSES